MNKEFKIKYKVWLARKQEYIENIFVSPWGFLLENEPYNGLVNVDDENHFYIIQSTCLFDRNGKEIYEGDVIEFKYHVGDLA